MFLQAYSRIVRPSTSLKFLGLFSTTVLKGRTSSLYLGNLPYSLPEAELSALVQQRIGNNFSQVRVPTDPLSGVNKGFGFIDFDETVELETVCTKLQGLMVEGRAVLCSLADPSMTAVIPGTGEIRDNTSLFVGNIGFLTDPELVKTAITNSLGASAISSIIVHRNENNVNKGYAHIHLHSPELINDALAKLQGIKVDGRALRVDLSRVGETSASYVDAAKHLIKRGNLSKLPAAEVPLGCELFVTNFDINLNEERMYELINKEVGPNSGAIVRFMQDSNGLSKGFCFFRFPTPEAAQAAKDKLNDLEIMGRKLVVEVSTSAPRKAGPSANMVVLSNLPLDFNQELLDEMLGDVIGAGLTVHTNVRMTSTGLCAGVARVEFIDAETANRAITELNGLEVMERAIYAVSAEKLKESTERRTAVKTTYEVYVSNVEPTTSFFQFKEVIEKHLGSLVVKTRLCMNEETAQCRGYGFIHCSSAEDAERAISELSKITVNGKQLSAQMADDDRNKARGPSAGRGGGGFGGGRGGGGRGGGGRGRGGGGGGRGRGGSQESSYREYHTVPEMDDCMQDLDMTIFKDFL